MFAADIAKIIINFIGKVGTDTGFDPEFDETKSRADSDEARVSP